MMKNFKALLLIFLGLIIASGISLAADPPKEDKFGNYPVGTVLNPKTGKPMTAQEIQAAERSAAEFKMEEIHRKAEEERQKQEAERLRQEEERRRQEEAARQPRCNDYQYYGPNARPRAAQVGGYECPPAYHCHRNGILYECRIDSGVDENTVVTASGGRCFWSYCAD